MIKKIKVSELPHATSLEGLNVLGVDAVSNHSVKAAMDLLKGNVGAKGDRGDSGVYVGATPPTDGSVNIAIDPLGDEYSGVPSGGKTGEVLTKTASTDFSTSWGSPLRALFVARGAVWNAMTGFYELNGLTDITEEQMMEIYNYTSQALSTDTWSNACSFTKIRTNFTRSLPPTPENITINGEQAFAMCNKLEKVVLHTGNMPSKRCSFQRCIGMFAFSNKLVEIVGEMDVSTPTNHNLVDMFLFCDSLKEVKIFNLGRNISFKHSKNLSRNSILFLIINSDTTSKTVTLHADAFARLTEADIALASSKNITLAA